MVPTHVRKWPARKALSLGLLALALFGPGLFRSKVVSARVQRESAPAVPSLMYRTDKILKETTRSNTSLPSVKTGISASIGEITEAEPPIERAKMEESCT